MTIEEITSAEALEKLRPEWEALWRSCDLATPFLHPGWLIPWWEAFGPAEQEPYVIIMRGEDGKLEGVAPAFSWRRQDGKRQLSFIGAGISDYCGIVFAEGKGDLFAHEFIGRIAKRAGDVWDECALEDVMSGSPLLNAVSALNKQRGAACPVVSLPDSFDEYLAGLSGAKRERLLRAQKKLVRLGMRTEIAAPQETGRATEIFFRLHEESWRHRGNEGVINSAPLKKFYMKAAEALAQAGALRLYLMGTDSPESVYAAALFTMFHKKRVYCYLGGFAPEFEKLSAGSVIVMHAIKDAIEAGMYEFDFLRGGEAHKYSWGAMDKFNWNLTGID